MTRRQLDESLAVRRAVSDAMDGVVEDTDPSLRRSRLPRVLHDSPAADLRRPDGTGFSRGESPVERVLA